MHGAAAGKAKTIPGPASVIAGARMNIARKVSPAAAGAHGCCVACCCRRQGGAGSGASKLLICAPKKLRCTTQSRPPSSTWPPSLVLVARSARKMSPAHVPHTGFPPAENWRSSGMRPHRSATSAMVVLSPPAGAGAGGVVGGSPHTCTPNAHAMKAAVEAPHLWSSPIPQEAPAHALTWDDEPLDALQLLLGPHLHRLHAWHAAEAAHVFPEGALQGQHPNAGGWCSHWGLNPPTQTGEWRQMAIRAGWRLQAKCTLQGRGKYPATGSS